ncbi:DUF3017 domain-containing protein [Cellulomonas bogoriensis]|uniref:DUF3017 domain-containing protein n=1 Tax=Cellulomonas bogoriensis 69B4 = DSM 16987 TaxID=1386082 RepID=A0A0A0BQX0_9CELL|nr:DUF3017 domain-containing protein [Cellulomonas bogoriensis]KGM09499.1 hypothetical protein N869_07030 [Cellulomonas bogoriensis 69B4 = DSM 16987]
MTPGPSSPPAAHAASPERHRAPALWLVVTAIVTAALAARWFGSGTGARVLALALLVAAVARTVGRGRRPEGIAVRSTWVDVLLLVSMGGAIAVLSFSPGV